MLEQGGQGWSQLWTGALHFDDLWPLVYDLDPVKNIVYHLLHDEKHCSHAKI